MEYKYSGDYDTNDLKGTLNIDSPWNDPFASDISVYICEVSTKNETFTYHFMYNLVIYLKQQRVQICVIQ